MFLKSHMLSFNTLNLVVIEQYQIIVTNINQSMTHSQYTLELENADIASLSLIEANIYYIKIRVHNLIMLL